MEEIRDPAAIRRFLTDSDFEAQFSFPVAPLTRLFCAARGDYILREGEQSDQMLYYLVEGRAKLRLSMPNGKVALLDFPKARCFLGEMELLGVRDVTLEIRALERCWLLALPVRACREALLGDCVFLANLCRYLGEKERKKTVALSRTQGYPLANRLADFVLTAASDGRYRERNTDASEYLGVSYRHLQQVLGDFVRAGYLKKDARGYVIADEQSLRALAGEMTLGYGESGVRPK